MARALKPQEAQVFEDAALQIDNFASLHDSAEDLLKRREEPLELTSEASFWFAAHFPGSNGT